jgi:tetratricopeptide (TPR) repeat protein
MSATVSRREGVVLGFFWVVTIAVVVMTLVNLVKDPAAKPRQEAQAAPDAATIEGRITQLKARLSAAPTEVETMVELGDIYLDTQRAMEAFRLFQRAIELAPGHTHALSDLGILHEQLGQYDKALVFYRRAYESSPGHSSLLLRMALLHSRHLGENVRALELLRTFLANNPEAQLVATAEQEIARIEQVLKTSGGAPANTRGTKD